MNQQILVPYLQLPGNYPQSTHFDSSLHAVYPRKNLSSLNLLLQRSQSLGRIQGLQPLERTYITKPSLIPYDTIFKHERWQERLCQTTARLNQAEQNLVKIERKRRQNAKEPVRQTLFNKVDQLKTKIQPQTRPNPLYNNYDLLRYAKSLQHNGYNSVPQRVKQERRAVESAFRGDLAVLPRKIAKDSEGLVKGVRGNVYMFYNQITPQHNSNQYSSHTSPHNIKFTKTLEYKKLSDIIVRGGFSGLKSKPPLDRHESKQFTSRNQFQHEGRVTLRSYIQEQQLKNSVKHKSSADQFNELIKNAVHTSYSQQEVHQSYKVQRPSDQAQQSSQFRQYRHSSHSSRSSSSQPSEKVSCDFSDLRLIRQLIIEDQQIKAEQSLLRKLKETERASRKDYKQLLSQLKEQAVVMMRQIWNPC